MQNHFLLKRLSCAARSLRTHVQRTTNILQTTAASRLSAHPLPRSFINSGAVVPTATRNTSLAPIYSLVGEALESCTVRVSQLCKYPSQSDPISSVVISLKSDGVEVRHGQRDAFVPLRWLRDHCTAPVAYDAKSNSRLSLVPLSADEWAARDMQVDDDSACLRITWRDGRKSTYSADWLAATVLPKMPSKCVPDNFFTEPPVIWESRPLHSAVACMSEGNLPTVSNNALARPSGILRACSFLHRFGVVFIDDLEASEIATRSMIERFGVLRNSMFGSFWAFQADSAMDDLA